MSYLLSQRERVVGLHSNGEQPLESVGNGVGSGGSSGVANAEGEGSNVPHTLQDRENITICIQTATACTLSNSYLTCKLNNYKCLHFFSKKIKNRQKANSLGLMQNADCRVPFLTTLFEI